MIMITLKFFKNVNFSLKFLDYFVPSILTLTHLIIQLSNVSRCQPVDNDQMRFFEIFDFLKYECHQGLNKDHRPSKESE